MVGSREESVGARVEAARLRKKWSRAQLARKAGFRTADDIEKIEGRLQHMIPRSLAERLATALGMQVTQLLGEERR